LGPGCRSGQVSVTGADKVTSDGGCTVSFVVLAQDSNATAKTKLQYLIKQKRGAKQAYFAPGWMKNKNRRGEYGLIRPCDPSYNSM
jgi:hypothetical protein